MNEYMDLNIKNGEHFRFPVYVGNQTFMDSDISDLALSVRAYNCLKRGGYNTVGEIVEQIGGRDDLLKIRNLGKRTAAEIMFKIMMHQYSLLKPDRRKRYLERVLELNGGV